MPEETQSQEGQTTQEGEGQSTEPQTFTIKVDGKEETLTQDQLIERAQKGTAAEVRMQKAAEAVKRAESAEAVVASLQAMEEQWDEAHFVRVATAAKMDPVKMNSVIAQFRERDAAAQQAPAQGGQQPQPQQPVGFRDLDPTLQTTNSEVYWDLVDRRLATELDNDEFLGKIKDEKVRAEAFSIARDKVVQKSAGRTVRPEAMQAAISETRGQLQRLGTQLDPSIPPGSGKAPGTSSTTSSATKPTERVPMSDPRYDDNFLTRLQEYDQQARED